MSDEEYFKILEIRRKKHFRSSRLGMSRKEDASFRMGYPKKRYIISKKEKRLMMNPYEFNEKHKEMLSRKKVF